MRADAFLEALDALPLADLAGIAGYGGVVVVAPHPDDESLGCGGLIAQACGAGRDVRVIVLSDGCGSHPKSRAFPPTRLRDLREAETLAAAAALGLPSERVRFLRLPDAAIPHAGPGAEAAAAIVREAALACKASSVFVTWRYDPHCDHAAAAAIVELARPTLRDARVFAYPIWAWALPPGMDVGPAPAGFRLLIAAERDAKHRAVAAHASQVTGLIADDPAGFRLDPATIARLCGPDEFFVAVSR